ncbi:hypothetical protein ACFQE5_01875 [Pseudonocardia hispaniensis]|uniref:Uncharacterized protein n=1 Tax=Pseudonocardia hispaniensis TaxID=904933 RepID=A0ABW1IWW1_9PSEU
MTLPDFQVLVARTRTGEIVDSIDQPGWSFDEPLAWGEAGRCDVTVDLPGRDRAGQILRSTLRGIAAGMSSVSLAIVRDRTVLWAGPVVTLGWDATGVNIGCATLDWVYERRTVVADGYWHDPADEAANLVRELLPRDLVLELLARATAGPGRNLPVSLPAQSGAEGATVTYLGADLRTTRETVAELVDADGGPDVLLRPQLSPDMATLSWDVAVGDPHLGGPNDDAVWDFPLVAVSGDLDDSETATVAYAAGDAPDVDGGEKRRLVGVYAVDRGDPWLVLERADRTNVSNAYPDQLAALAKSYQQQYAQAVEEITLAAPTDAGPAYRTTWNLGDTGGFTVTGHPWLDDVDTRRRIIAVSMTPAELKLTTIGARLTPGSP